MTRRRNNNGQGRRARRTPAQVIVADPVAGNDGARLDRIMSHLQNSHSQIRVLINQSVNIGIAATDTIGNYTASNVFLSDEFVSFRAQFETYRIMAIRFDIYDANTGVPTTGVFSTFHDSTNGTYTPFTFAQIIDSPDAQVCPPGTGKLSLTWFAHGTNELEFQSSASAALPPVYDYGGLRYSVSPSPGVGTTALKYTVLVKAVVDFRGRF